MKTIQKSVLVRLLVLYGLASFALGSAVGWRQGFDWARESWRVGSVR